MVSLEDEQLLQQEKKEAEGEANLLLIKESNRKAWKKAKASFALAFKSADTLQEQEEFSSNLKQMIFLIDRKNGLRKQR